MDPLRQAALSSATGRSGRLSAATTDLRSSGAAGPPGPDGGLKRVDAARGAVLVVKSIIPRWA